MFLFVAGIEGLPIDQDLSKVMVIKMKPINSAHPAVQELVGSGYSDAEAIHALQMCGGSLEAALNYLMARTDGELFHSVLSKPDNVAVTTTGTARWVIYIPYLHDYKPYIMCFGCIYHTCINIIAQICNEHIYVYVWAIQNCCALD